MKSTSSKKAIREAFSRASSTYDSFNQIQRLVNTRLMSLVPRGQFHCVLELGCGTGSFTSLLVEALSPRFMVAIDLSPDMIKRAKAVRGIQNRLEFVVADGEDLPFRPRSFDLIVSASCMHWFSQLEDSLARLIGTYLRSGGWICAALFGQKSLIELQRVVNIMSQGQIMLPTAMFPREEDLYRQLQGRLNGLEIHRVTLTRYYNDLFSLLKTLKRTGVTPRVKGPIVFGSRRAIREGDRVYRELFGEIRASYEVILFSGHV